MSKPTWVRLKGTGWSLIVFSTLLLGLPLYAAILEPKILIEDWDLFLVLLVLPWTVGIALLLYARKLRRAA